MTLEYSQEKLEVLIWNILKENWDYLSGVILSKTEHIFWNYENLFVMLQKYFLSYFKKKREVCFLEYFWKKL